MAKLLGQAEVFVCDVEHEEQIDRLRDELAAQARSSTAWSIRSPSPTTPPGPKPFHETPKQAFLQAVDISCFSLIAMCNALKDLLDADASVVTISISSTRMASENYGYMAPDQGGPGPLAGFPGQVVQPVFAGAIQRRGPGIAEDLGLGGHPRLRRVVSLRRAGDSAKEGGRRPRRRPTWRRSC